MPYKDDAAQKAAQHRWYLEHRKDPGFFDLRNARKRDWRAKRKKEKQMSMPPVGTMCVECVAKGHRCQAQTYEGSAPLCLPCRDGDPCSVERVAKVKKDTELVDVFVVPAEPHGPVVSIPIPKAKNPAPSGSRTCRAPGCSRKLASHNLNGCCWQHERFAKLNPITSTLPPSKAEPEQVEKEVIPVKVVATHVINGETVAMSTHAVMGPEMLEHLPANDHILPSDQVETMLRKVSEAQQAGLVPDPIPAPGMPKSAAQPEPPAEASFSLRVTAQHLDAFWQRLELNEKGSIIQRYLDGQYIEEAR